MVVSVIVSVVIESLDGLLQVVNLCFDAAEEALVLHPLILFFIVNRGSTVLVVLWLFLDDVAVFLWSRWSADVGVVVSVVVVDAAICCLEKKWQNGF